MSVVDALRGLRGHKASMAFGRIDPDRVALPEFWESLYGVTADNAAILIRAEQPAMTRIAASNMKHFRYTWMYEREQYGVAARGPILTVSHVLVFYRKLPSYTPQMRKGFKAYQTKQGHQGQNYGATRPGYVTVSNGDRFPLQSLSLSLSLSLFDYMRQTYNSGNGPVVLFGDDHARLLR